MTAFIAPTPITVTVTVDGNIISDGADPAASPFVIEGLSVGWGRSTTVDQPEATTASFTVHDSAAKEFLTRCRVGRMVAIRATGQIQTGDTLQTLTAPAPDWDTLATGPAPARIKRTGMPGPVLIEPNPAGGQWIRAVDPTGQGGFTLTIPPADPVPQTDPTGWDHIPKSAAGQQWNVSVSGWAPAGVRLRVGMALYSTPWSQPQRITLTSAWEPASGPFSGHYYPRPGLWLGLWVTLDQMPTLARWMDVDPAVSWPEYPGAWRELAGFAIDDTALISPVGPLPSSVLVFAGRITDATAEYDQSTGAVVVTVTANDFLSDLANRDVGAEPWAAETLAARVGRILGASGMSVSTVIDSGPGAEVVTRMDVDRQQVATMLQELAGGVDAVLWPAAHETLGAYLWIEDPVGRAGGATLAMSGSTVVIVAGTPAGAITVNSCDFLLDPVVWGQSVADAATRVAVTWRDQSTTPDPTDQTVTIIDAAMEAPTNIYGTRRVSVGSQVVSAASATRIANQILARLKPDLSWRATGFVWSLLYADAVDNDAVGNMLTLLDGTTRIGKPLVITDLPAWLPVSGDVIGYVEGGTYTYEAGAWSLNLTLSAAPPIAGDSAVWQELPADWAWNEFDPNISWSAMQGVTAPALERMQ